MKPFDWEANGYADCKHCHGGFPVEQMEGDVCRWCKRRELNTTNEEDAR